MNRLAILPFLLLAAPLSAQKVVVEVEPAKPPAPVRESSPDANVWLDKAERALHASNLSWKFEQQIKVAMSLGPDADPIEAPMTRTGTVVFTDKMAARLDAVKVLEFPGMPEAMKLEEVIVFRDGVFYVDRQSMGSFEERTLMSITLAEAVALRQELSGMLESPTFAPFFDPNPMHASPGDTLGSIRKQCAFQEVAAADGVVTLSGPGSPMLAPSGVHAASSTTDQVVDPTVTLTVDQATGRPLQLIVGDSADPAFRMSFSEFATIKVDPARFDLNPQGKELPSLTDAIRREMEMRQQMSGQHTADEEF